MGRIGEKKLLNFKKFAIQAAQAASDKKGENIVILNVKKLTSVGDYFIIVSVNSLPQAQAVKDEIEERLGQHGIALLNRQQQLSKRWILLDFGGMIVHIFVKESREFFNLERLWSKATKVKWEK